MPNVYILPCLELSRYSPTFALFFMVLDLRLVKDWLSRDNQFFLVPTPTNDDWQAVCATPFRSRNKDNGMQAMEGLLLPTCIPLSI